MENHENVHTHTQDAVRILVLGCIVGFLWDCVRDYGFRLNLGFWKIKKSRKYDWDKYFREKAKPVTNKLVREAFKRSRIDPDTRREI
ncbi:MAG: hypothetical protein R3B55_01305 [Candidatus Paceibacterota bacterium]